MTPAQILLDLVALPSVSASTNRAVIDYARSRLDPSLWDFAEFPHAPGQINLVAKTRSGGAADAADAGLALICHTDTVPYEADWTEAVHPVARDGNIYGRGSADVKGFLACILAAASRAAAQPLHAPLAIVLTSDEEIGCLGAKHLAAQRAFRARYAIIGEPTSLTPIRAGKGYALGHIVVRGREAHSAYPAAGRSAIYDAARVIAALERVATALATQTNADFDPPYTTLNIGLIEGGTAKNIVAGECRLTVEWRPVPAQDPHFAAALIREELAKLSTSHGVNAELRVSRADPPFAPSPTADLATFLASLTSRRPSTIAFGSEAAHLQSLANEIVVFGPGDMSTAHRTGEHVPISDLDRCLSCLESAITRYCLT